MNTAARTGITGIIALLLTGLAFSTMSCIDDPPTHPDINENQSYLDLVWELYDQKYVGFDGKDADWDQIHEQYSQMAASADSTDELMEVVVQMVGELHDRNAFLVSGSTVVPAWGYDFETNYDDSVLMDYLEPWDFQWDSSGGVMWGSCVIDTIPYFAIRHFDFFFTYMHFRDEFITHLDAPGIIIDIRMSDGVSLVPAIQLCGVFTDQPMDAFLTQHRTGPEHEDLSPLELHDVSPRTWAFTKPVVLLAGEQNIGPADAFCHVMSRVPHVTIVGDTTGGGGNTPGFMNQQYWPLWDFWEMTCPFARVLKVDSTSIEDSGILPDIYVEANQTHFSAGEDPVLEYALEWIAGETAP